MKMGKRNDAFNRFIIGAELLRKNRLNREEEPLMKISKILIGGFLFSKLVVIKEWCIYIEMEWIGGLLEDNNN